MSLVDRNPIEASKAQRLQHVSCVRVDLDRLLFQRRNFRDKVQSSFTFFLLQLQGNTTDRALGNTTHQVRRVPCNLVPHTFGRQNSHLIDDAFVRVKIDRQTRIVLLDDCTSALLDSLCADTL